MPISAHCRRRISPRCAETFDKGHARLEQRRLLASTALNDYVDFPSVAQLCRFEREITALKSAKQRRESVFAITRLTPEQADPHKLLQLNRGHWAFENRSHYVRDRTFDEDQSRICVGNGPAMMARLHGFTNIASALRAFAHQPRRALAAVGV